MLLLGLDNALLLGLVTEMLLLGLVTEMLLLGLVTEMLLLGLENTSLLLGLDTTHDWTSGRENRHIFSHLDASLRTHLNANSGSGHGKR